MGREALAWLLNARPDVDPVAFFTAGPEEPPDRAEVDLPTVATVAALRSMGCDAVLLGIGANAPRGRVLEQVVAAGFELMTALHPTAFIGPGVTFGDGCIVAPGAILTRDVSLGVSVIVNYGAKIGHDCRVDDLVFVGPGAILTGAVHVYAGALIGAGAVILPGVSIGAGAIVGAGAVVLSDVAEGATVAGVPSRSL